MTPLNVGMVPYPTQASGLGSVPSSSCVLRAPLRFASFRRVSRTYGCYGPMLNFFIPSPLGFARAPERRVVAVGALGVGTLAAVVR